MPVQIGAKAHDVSEPLGLLSDCHRRIEMFLGILEAIAKTLDRPPTDEARRALDSALRYFREAAPKHTADEEESLFPRLRKMQHTAIQAAISRLEELEGEHLWAEPLHAQVEELGRKYLKLEKLSRDEVEKFRDNVGKLSAMYKRHISMEDNELFPVASRVLPDPEKQAIAEEMAKRRASH